jgi:predicted NUDIX family NTP pyrophosphohydrolase
MPQTSAGLLMYRHASGEVQYFLVHPGGPFYTKKDVGVWTIPKGLAEKDEDLLTAAKREFEEETGIVPEGEFTPLGTVKLKTGKVVHAWAFEGNWNEADGISSNTFEMEWPPRSRKRIAVPEADRASWFSYPEVKQKIHEAQIPFIERLRELIT